MPILLALFAFFVIRLIQMNAVAQQTGIDIGVLAYKIDMSQIEVLVEDMAICIVLILAATGLSITAWIYRSIVTPILPAGGSREKYQGRESKFYR